MLKHGLQTDKISEGGPIFILNGKNEIFLAGINLGRDGRAITKWLVKKLR